MHISYYKHKIGKFQKEHTKLQKTSQKYSIWRLVIFIVGLALFYSSFTINNWLAYLILFIFISGFIIVYKRQTLTTKRINELDKLIRIHENEIGLLKGEPNLFGDGKEFMEWQHFYTNDLDIFGSHSIFEMMNRTVTFEGKNRLAQWLSGEKVESEELYARQKAIDELSANEAFKEKLLVESVHLSGNNSSQDNILQWFHGFKFSFLRLKSFKYVFHFTSAVLITLIPVSFLYDFAYILLFAGILISLSFYFAYFRKVNHLHDKISKQSDLFSNYARLVNIISLEKFASIKLNNLSNELNKPDQIIRELKVLSHLIEQLDYRLNAYVAFILNTFFFWDIQKSIQIEVWLQKNQSMVDQWLAPITQIDVLLSISIFKFNHPEFVFPEFSAQEDLYISTIEIGHPLINSQQRICNDYELKGNGHFDIITGSNMAGKTTFLRTLGVNAVLAYCGAPVCAKKLVLSRFRIMTYMRITDSLEYNLSTFHAEIQRIRQILSFAKEKGPCLLLLDELLRGTNSKDRATGTHALIMQLMNDNATGLISTHDLGLTRLEKEKPQRVRNFHFNIVNIENDLDFDYKLKNGVSQSTNAAMLLKKIGLELD